MSKFKVVPTPDHGTRLVPIDPTPKTEEEWLAAACEHDITYGQDPTPPGSHTPGPWELRGSRLVTDPHGVVIAEHISANGPGTPEANARLIAAAPELLEALENLLAAQVDPMGIKAHKACKAAAVVIAKATGH